MPGAVCAARVSAFGCIAGNNAVEPPAVAHRNFFTHDNGANGAAGSWQPFCVQIPELIAHLLGRVKLVQRVEVAYGMRQFYGGSAVHQDPAVCQRAVRGEALNFTFQPELIADHDRPPGGEAVKHGDDGFNRKIRGGDDQPREKLGNSLRCNHG